MNVNYRFRSPRRASGFTMIEVLIAILVLAFGLLGFAFLQTMNVRFTKSAEQRTVATNLAYELVDIMRSQRALGSYYNLIKRASFKDVVVPPSGCARPVSSTPAANIARWKCEVRAALPDGSAEVVLGAEGALTVEIFWDDDNWSDPEKIGDPEKNSKVKVETRL